MGAETKPHDTRLNKASAVSIYRPPALRNNNITQATNIVATVQNSSTNDTKTEAITQLQAELQEPIAATTGTETTVEVEMVVPIAISMPNGQYQRQRRERRPDREVYIPRARRSQTTPPAATTTTTAAPATTTTISASVDCQQATTPSNNAYATSASAELKIVTDSDSVCAIPASKMDESEAVAITKKSKSGANGKERKERVKKAVMSDKSCRLESAIDAATTTIIKTSDAANNSKVTKNFNCDNSEEHVKKAISSNAHSTIETELNNSKLKNELNNITRSSSGSKSGSGSGKKRLITNTIDTTTNLTRLRIEDAASNGVKCDIDAQELQRASKEINRSNRRIIKQTFVSDVLEIPEKINEDNYLAGEYAKTKHSTVPVAKARLKLSTTEEEDDWESKYDETGECLDPKIMQELEASLGKVKIEFPKTDYSAYLSKQTILNDEEFPHVLEVSNFPAEFKTTDLLMMFSQYKESGFDIKWVDDTHALAVFSSSRVAAEVLAQGHAFVLIKPLNEATVESRVKAKKCAASLLPYKPRPETCTALARRLVSSALGVRLKTTAEEREMERRVLREAKERKLLAAKQRDEAWEN